MVANKHQTSPEYTITCWLFMPVSNSTSLVAAACATGSGPHREWCSIPHDAMLQGVRANLPSVSMETSKWSVQRRAPETLTVATELVFTDFLNAEQEQHACSKNTGTYINLAFLNIKNPCVCIGVHVRHITSIYTCSRQKRKNKPRCVHILATRVIVSSSYVGRTDANVRQILLAVLHNTCSSRGVQPGEKRPQLP